VELKRTHSRLAGAGVQLIPKKSACAVEPRLHRVLVDVEALGRIERAQTLDFPKHEHDAIVLRQGVYGRLEHAAQLCRERLMFGVRLTRRRIAGRDLIDRHGALCCRPPAARSGQRLVHGNFRQPGREAPRSANWSRWKNAFT
jgi:hypothetical protein